MILSVYSPFQISLLVMVSTKQKFRQPIVFTSDVSVSLLNTRGSLLLELPVHPAVEKSSHWPDLRGDVCLRSAEWWMEGGAAYTAESAEVDRRSFAFTALSTQTPALQIRGGCLAEQLRSWLKERTHRPYHFASVCADRDEPNIVVWNLCVFWILSHRWVLKT